MGDTHLPTQIDADVWIRRIFLFCLVSIALIGCADFFFYFLGWFPSEIVARSFNIALEESLGTWFSSTQALMVGLTALGITCHSRKHDASAIFIGWLIVALFFIYVSFDDAAKFHERLGTAMRVKYEGLSNTRVDSWFPSWSWQLFLAPLFIAVGAYILFFLWCVMDKGAIKWVILAFSFFGIAVAIDFVEGMELSALTTDSASHLLKLLEEMLEMFGTALFLYVFLLELNKRIAVYLTDSYVAASDRSI